MIFRAPLCGIGNHHPFGGGTFGPLLHWLDPLKGLRIWRKQEVELKLLMNQTNDRGDLYLFKKLFQRNQRNQRSTTRCFINIF